MNSISDALEQYLLRIDPSHGADWRGASEEEIARVQALTPHAVPPVYLWFLRRMGRSMGPMAYPTCDFSAARILAAYHGEDAEEIALDRRYLMIGYENDEMMQLHTFLDLERRARDDALVLRCFASGADRHLWFETLTEMLAWGKCGRFRISSSPRHCRGSFEDPNRTLFANLDPVMRTLGFEQPVPTGDYCRVYEREDATMSCGGSIDNDALSHVRFFRLGARKESLARSILGAVGIEARLSVQVTKWSDASFSM